jgi:hypothetical protein
VYCCQPTGFTDPAHPDLVCHLRKSLYGLKQAPRAWYSRFVSYLTTLGFIEAKSDTSLFIFRRGSDTVYLLLYVDDIILTASSTELLRRTISALQREFAMDLGPLHHFLGITVERRPDGLFLHQRTYTLDILKRAVMTDCKPCTSPVDLQAKLADDSGPPVAEYCRSPPVPDVHTAQHHLCRAADLPARARPSGAPLDGHEAHLALSSWDARLRLAVAPLVQLRLGRLHRHRLGWLLGHLSLHVGLCRVPRGQPGLLVCQAAGCRLPLQRRSRVLCRRQWCG